MKTDFNIYEEPRYRASTPGIDDYNSLYRAGHVFSHFSAPTPSLEPINEVARRIVEYFKLYPGYGRPLFNKLLNRIYLPANPNDAFELMPFDVKLPDTAPRYRVRETIYNGEWIFHPGTIAIFFGWPDDRAHNLEAANSEAERVVDYLRQYSGAEKYHPSEVGRYEAREHPRRPHSFRYRHGELLPSPFDWLIRDVVLPPLPSDSNHLSKEERDFKAAAAAEALSKRKGWEQALLHGDTGRVVPKPKI